MEQNQVSCGSVVYDRLPPLSSKYPWLVAQNLEAEEEEESGDQFFYTVNDDPMCHYRCRIPELIGRRIRGCFHGWVILSYDPHNVMWCLWNPVTSKIIQLPPLILIDGDPQSIGDCCLSFPPDDPNSLLLLTRTDRSTFVFCRLDRKRKRLRWTEMSYSKQLKKISGNGRLLSNLTCCNGKVYASNTDGFVDAFVIQVDIVVKDREVVIKLFLLTSYPSAPYNRCYDSARLLKGSGTELFCIEVGFKEPTRKTIGLVCLFKLDMTSINWEIIDSFKERDMSPLMDELLAAEYLQQFEMSSEVEEDMKNLETTSEMWEEMLDLKDTIFFLDLSRDNCVFYSQGISSESGGYIHIRMEMGTLIHSYCFKDKVISLCSMPSPVLPTSHVSMWEFSRSEDKHEDGKCLVDSKQEKDEILVVRSDTDDVGLNDSYLLNLPFDILEMITKFCVCVDYMNFRATCKRCHLAAHETPLRRLQKCSPWLMVLDKDRQIITFTNPMLGDNYFIKNLPISIRDDRICCSRYGWLLFYDNLRGLVFYNPITGDIRELPNAGSFIGGLCFSAPPTSPDCMVVGFRRRDVYIHFVAREPSWHMLRLDFNIGNYKPFDFYFPTFNRRDIYVLSYDGGLHVFKYVDDEHYYGEKVVAKIPRISSAEYFLIECDQHLLLVVVDKCGKSVDVLKLNDSTKKWEEINGIGSHMIYICGTTCICIEAKSPEMENKIYFPRFSSKNQRMVFYSLEIRMFHTFNDKNVDETFSSQDFAGTYQHHHLYPDAWIEPS